MPLPPHLAHLQPLVDELSNLNPKLVPILEQQDAASQLSLVLPCEYPLEASNKESSYRAWELCGLYFRNQGRDHEALGIFWQLYLHMVEAQEKLRRRIHKGMPLIWISDCFRSLNCPVHTKRYLMLTLCEDALRGSGDVSPETTGVYFRWVWIYGLPHDELASYAKRLNALSQELPEISVFPEALVQRIDDDWLNDLPSANEALFYRINPFYTRHLLARLSDKTGETLELVCEYLMSCMPGCRTKRRERSPSTDYDIVCAMEGLELDFRSELGRHFVCECKAWSAPAGFTAMAKFCRVLDSTKSKFGVLFSKEGISGAGKTIDAEREQLKIFQDRGTVIVVVSQADLEEVANGANFIALLRRKYETVRLDLKAHNRPG